MSLSGKKILVIGANGFVGSRVCERLVLDQQAEVTGLVRNMGRSARIGRLKMRIVRGSILDKELLTGLLKEVDVVIDLVAKSKSAMIQGTGMATELARGLGIERYVYMSTAAVHGLEARPEFSEEGVPLRKTGNPYSDVKIQAENIVTSEIAKGLAGVCLRPRIIWGPYSAWVTRFYETIANGRFCLIDEGKGVCNTVFIDNLVDAVIWSIETDAAVGETFYVTDGELVTWRDYYGKWASFLDQPIEFVSLAGNAPGYNQSPPGFFARSKSFITNPLLRQALAEAPLIGAMVKHGMETMAEKPESSKIAIKRKLGMSWPEIEYGHPKPELPGLDPSRILRERGTGLTSIKKIQAFGFQPRINFETGSEITRTWLKAARYI